MGDNIPIIEPTIDYTKVPPIHQKRTISFINHFVVNTVSFLNKLALTCEEKLFEIENKLQRVEAAVVILESRLASIPNLEEKLPVESNEKTTTEETVKTETVTPEEVPEGTDEPDEKEEEKTDNELQLITQHPLYEKYFKMLNVGVPKQALKLKMAQEGLDPDLLDDPQRQVPKEQPKPAD